MKTVVTGAGGFIGSHLVEHLVASGDDVTAFIHYRGDGYRGWLEESYVLKDVQVVANDICDMDSVIRVAAGCDVIFNLAAQISIPHSYDSPERFLATNAGGAINVLTAARHHGCRVVQMSTSETYGSAQKVPMSEDHPVNAQSPYAASKVAADQLCFAFRKSYGVDVCIARPFNVFGPRQSQRSVIPNVIAQMLRGSTSIRVGTLTATRDFTYVSDTVRALQIVGSRGSNGVFNIGSGKEISIADLVIRIARALRRQATPELSGMFTRPADSEVQRLMCDPSRMRELGWRPEVSLDVGISRVAEWLGPRLDRLRKGRVT